MRWLVVAMLLVGCDERLRKPDHTEGNRNIHVIAARAKEIAEATGAFPIASIPPTPAAPCCQPVLGRRRCTPSAADWKAWAPLEFAMDAPHDARYSYVSTGQMFVAIADADYTCGGGRRVMHVAIGTLVDGKPVVTTTRIP